jgi:predicted peptidase
LTQIRNNDKFKKISNIRSDKMRRYFLILMTFLLILATCFQTGFCKNYGSINTSPQIKKYILTVPKKYKDGDPKLPLVVYLHGAGSLNNYNSLQSWDAANLVKQQSNYSFILFAPLFTNQDDWSANFQSLKNMLDQIIAQYPVDTTRIYLTGLSMGGRYGWEFAMQNPNLFAAFAPLAGGPLKSNWSEAEIENIGVLKDLPIRTYHSKDDDTVPYSSTVQIVEALTKAGGTPTLITLPGSEHAILGVYNQNDFWDWLFSNQKNN